MYYHKLLSSWAEGLSFSDESGVKELAFSARSVTVAVLIEENYCVDTIQLWNALNGAQAGRIKYHVVSLRHIRFSDQHEADDRIESDRGRFPRVQSLLDNDSNPPGHQFPQTGHQILAPSLGDGGEGGRICLSNESGNRQMLFEIRLDATPWVKG